MADKKRGHILEHAKSIRKQIFEIIRKQKIPPAF
jgi:hypothetical protein